MYLKIWCIPITVKNDFDLKNSTKFVVTKQPVKLVLHFQEVRKNKKFYVSVIIFLSENM